MVQNMRAYFILHVITTKCIKCTQEKTEFSCTKTKADLNQNFRRSLLGYKDKATTKSCKKIIRGSKKTASCGPGVADAAPCPPHSCGPGIGPSEDFKRQVFFVLSRKEIKKRSRAF